MNIKPKTILLSSGQAATFQATDPSGAPVLATWSVNPAIGFLAPPAASITTLTHSATYICPPVVAIAQTIVIIANTADDSASSIICLTPDCISLIPAVVSLKANESQQFVPILAGRLPGAGIVAQLVQPEPAQVAPPGQQSTSQPATAATGAETVSGDQVRWTLSPRLGSIDQATGIYIAPEVTSESTIVTLIAEAPGCIKPAIATINLVPLPWKGAGVHWLGTFLLLIFSLVCLLVALWPPALPILEAAKAERLEAEKSFQDRTAARDAAASSVRQAAVLTAQAQSATPKDLAKLQTASAAAAKAQADLDAANQERDRASTDLEAKRQIEANVKDPYINTALIHHISRDVDVLLLVLLAGALGSFLHAARSYSEFLGNERLKRSWAWWYCLAPFTGSVLALVVYAAVRGGFLAFTSGADTKTSDLNPYGVASLAALVGMFSKDATDKLGELFKTLFKSDKSQESKDPLKQSALSSKATAPSTTPHE